MKKNLLFAILFIAGPGAMAQQDSSVLAQELKEVVITGQYRPQSVKQSVYQVRVINRDRIEKQAATQLQDILANELNIRFSQDPATGGSDITMMGLKGQNVKILIDGMPLIGRQGTSNEININQIDINSIERIEIVEGPMSVIYGADALAGVINIITRKTKAAKVSVQARLHEETVGDEYGISQGIHNQSLAFQYRQKGWDAGAGFTHNYFGGWQDTAIGRELAWHKKDQRLGHAYLGYHNSKFNLRYRIDALDEIITNPGNFEEQPQPGAIDRFARDQEYLSQRIMHQLQGSYFVNGQLSFNGQAAYTRYSRQVYSTLLSHDKGQRYIDRSPGSQGDIRFHGFSLRTTALYTVSASLSFQPGVDINLESGEGERLKEGSNRVNDYAFFLTSEWKATKNLSLRPGLRFIHNSVYNAPPLIPSLNAKWQMAKNLDLRMAYARGFRSPSLRELYFNFFDANHQIVGNPDLKAETSHSFTASLSWTKLTPSQVAYSTVVSGYYNSVKNLIDYAISANDPNVFELTNVSDSRTAGFSLSSMVKYRRWNLAVGGSFTGFYNDYSETDKELPELQWSPELNANVGYSIPSMGIDLNLFYKFTGRRPRYIASGNEFLLAKQDSYHWADFTVNKKLFRYFTLNAGIRNLFAVDRLQSNIANGGIHSGGTQSIAYGRSYFAGITFNWDKK